MTEQEFETFLRDTVDWDGYYTRDGEAMIKAHLDKIAALSAEIEQLRMAYGLAHTIPGAGNIAVDPSRPLEKMQEIVAAATAGWETLNSQVTLWKAGEPYEKEIDG